jgi:DNA-binding transcriptional ArsR family regulator
MLTKNEVNKIKKELLAEKERIHLILDVLGDQGRFLIFKLLIKHSELCVTDIANILDVTVSAASQQLRVLERLNLVKRIKMGQEVCYELKKDNFIVKQLIKFLISTEKQN